LPSYRDTIGFFPLQNGSFINYFGESKATYVASFAYMYNLIENLLYIFLVRKNIIFHIVLLISVFPGGILPMSDGWL